MLLHVELSVQTVGFTSDKEPVICANARSALSQLHSEAQGRRHSVTDPFDWPEYDKKEAERVVANFKAGMRGTRKRVLGVGEWVLEADSSEMAVPFHFVPEVKDRSRV